MAYKDKNDPRKKEARLRWYYKNQQKQVEKQAERKQKIAVWFLEFKKDLKCETCNETHPACLDFHHVNSKDKEFAVSKMVGDGASLEKIVKEIKKCKILCANCHRKLHFETDYRRANGCGFNSPSAC